MENSQAILGPGAVLSPALSPSLGACQGGSGLGLHLLELVELGGHSDQDHLFKTPSSTAYLPLFLKKILFYWKVRFCRGKEIQRKKSSIPSDSQN